MDVEEAYAVMEELRIDPATDHQTEMVLSCEIIKIEIGRVLTPCDETPSAFRIAYIGPKEACQAWLDATNEGGASPRIVEIDLWSYRVDGTPKAPQLIAQHHNGDVRIGAVLRKRVGFDIPSGPLTEAELDLGLKRLEEWGPITW